MTLEGRFAKQARNEALEIERAVEWTNDYVVVDKIPEAEPYVEDEPRGAPSS